MLDKIGTLILLVTLVIILLRMRKKKMKYEDKIKKVIKNFKRFDNKKIVKDSNGHIFGLPLISNTNKINLKDFNKIEEINYKDKYVTVEGSVYVKDVLDKLLKKNWIIEIPPDMVHLTFSGLIAGIGGGSSSFRYGFLMKL